MAKADPTKVIVPFARQAITLAAQANAAYTQYIKIHYRHTGRLAPGCDAKDLVAWYKQNMPAQWLAKGGK